MLRNLFLKFLFFLFFRMAKQLNASYSFQNGLLVCELTGDVVEVVLKIKMRWGKHTLIEDTTEQRSSAMERADRRVKISTRRKENPQINTGYKLKRR